MPARSWPASTACAASSRRPDRLLRPARHLPADREEDRRRRQGAQGLCALDAAGAFDRNLVVIGAGSAGLVTAYIAAAVKAKVTLIEKHKHGRRLPQHRLRAVEGADPLGEVPLAHRARRGVRHRRAAAPTIRFAEVMERVQRVVIRTVEPHDSVERYTGLGVEVVEGTAKHRLALGSRVTRHDGARERLSTRSIVIAAGARPFVPPIPGIEAVGYLTSDTVWDLRELPQTPGGARRRADRLRADAGLRPLRRQGQPGGDAAAPDDPRRPGSLGAGRRALPPKASTVLLNHKAMRFVVENGEKALVAEARRREVRIPFDAVLVAVGRVANLKGYGLEELGVAATRTVDTNEFLQTSYPNIYAAGDVAGPYQFTHTAAHQAWYAAVNALFDPFKKFKADYSVIPWATFVEPEVARVGLNETEAREKGIAHRGQPLRHRRPRPGDRRQRGARLRQGADRARQGPHPRRHHRRRARRRPDRRVRAGDEARHRLNKILGTIHIYPTLAEANKYVAGVWKKAHAPKACCAGWRASMPGGGAACCSAAQPLHWRPPGPGASLRPLARGLERAAGEARQDPSTTAMPAPSTTPAMARPSMRP
jgi:pyruvate/2-oxoglutarate dehydrogenase complex dihydrolipoamide dehydrogenase (E3) component